MTLGRFLAKQFIDVIQWNEPGEGTLAYRFPVDDMEIQSGGQLTVRDSQLALFVDQGKIADVFGPGLHQLTTRNLPLLTDLKNWDKNFESPFKSDVYFFSTRLQVDQKWGTSTPITVRDKEFGAVRLRAHGIYAYRIVDPRAFFTQISGTRDSYFASELEGQLRNTIVACMTSTLANSAITFLDMASRQTELSQMIAEQAKPAFTALGLSLEQFIIDNISLPDELQEIMDQRIGVNLAGDLGRYTQFEAAQALELAAVNAGGAAGMGVGLGAGAAMAKSLLTPAVIASPVSPSPSVKFCPQCGKPVPERARFCPECGNAQ